MLVGVPNKDAVFMTKPINVLNERTLKGTFFGNYKPRTDIPSVVDMYMNKVILYFPAITGFGYSFISISSKDWEKTFLQKLELDKFITHRVPFSDINKAFELMQNGEGLRCIINMEE